MVRHSKKAEANQTMNVDPVMSYMSGGAKLLTNPSVGGSYNRKVGISNIIQSTTEFPIVRTSMKGIIETSVPAHKQSGIHKAAATATPTTLGMRHIPGTTY